MKKLKWCSLIPLLLCYAQVAWGQVCQGYSSGQPSFTLLTPDQVAAQNGVTATINAQVTNVTGGVPSHNLTVTPGTAVAFYWSSNNGTGATDAYYTVDNDSTKHDLGNLGANGNNASNPWVMQNSDVGQVKHVFFVVRDANGNTTSDRINVGTAAGSSPSIFYEDNVHSNVYIEATSGFQGPSMANACTLCQMHPSECINKEHLPQQKWLSVANNTSGETQPGTVWNPGQKACETCSVSYTGTSPWISALPFDQVQFNVENQVICDEFGIIFDSNDSLGSLVPLPEWAWFKGTIKQSTCKLQAFNGAAGVACNYINPAQSPTCTTRSWPPDFQPTGVWVPSSMVPGYPDMSLVPPFWVTGSIGIRWPNIAGNRFVFPFFDLDKVSPALPPGLAAVTRLNNYSFASSSKIVDCTNYDAGIQPWFSPLIP